MAFSFKEIKISEVVESVTEVAQTYIPPNGKKIRTEVFEASAAFSKDSSVRLLWDYGGVGEELLWSSNGAIKFLVDVERTGDGVKKLAVVLVNSGAGDLSMSGLVRFEEEK